MFAKYSSLSELFLKHVKTYKSRSWRPFFVQFPWDSSIISHMESISRRRCEKRKHSYLIPGELQRAKQSIRFGHEKTGRGYKGERGDFCLLAGVYHKGTLTLFYRTVELIGGLHFDLCLIGEVEKHLGKVRTVRIAACSASVFALRGVTSKSKERLFAQMTEYHRGQK